MTGLLFRDVCIPSQSALSYWKVIVSRRMCFRLLSDLFVEELSDICVAVKMVGSHILSVIERSVWLA